MAGAVRDTRSVGRSNGKKRSILSIDENAILDDGKNWDVIFFKIVKARPANYDKQMRLGNAARSGCSSQGLSDFSLSLVLAFSPLPSRGSERNSVFVGIQPSFSRSFGVFLCRCQDFPLRGSRFSPSSCSLPLPTSRRAKPRERGGYATVVGAKAEEEKEEEAQRDSYLLLSLFLLFSCPPSPAAPSSFIALLLSCAPRSHATRSRLALQPLRRVRGSHTTRRRRRCFIFIAHLLSLSPCSPLLPSLTALLPFFRLLLLLLLLLLFLYLPPACRSCLWSVLSKRDGDENARASAFARYSSFFFPLSLPLPLPHSLARSLPPSLSLSRLLLSSRILFSRSLFIPRISPRAPEWLNTKIIEPGVARARARSRTPPLPLLPPPSFKS